MPPAVAGSIVDREEFYYRLVLVPLPRLCVPGFLRVVGVEADALAQLGEVHQQAGGVLAAGHGGQGVAHGAHGGGQAVPSSTKHSIEQ